jgi:hypothetical protein
MDLVLNVNIFSAVVTLFQTDNYLNDWPSTAIEFKNINPVFILLQHKIIK